MIGLIFLVFRIFELVILVRVIMSWVHPYRDNPFSDWIYRLTEPVLEPIRSVLPVGRVGIDFSPLILLFLLQIIRRVMMQSLYAF